jgi:hypothetical protein
MVASPKCDDRREKSRFLVLHGSRKRRNRCSGSSRSEIELFASENYLGTGLAHRWSRRELLEGDDYIDSNKLTFSYSIAY